jgi:hypothetical protein
MYLFTYTTILEAAEWCLFQFWFNYCFNTLVTSVSIYISFPNELSIIQLLDA